MNYQHFLDSVDKSISNGVEKGILHLVQNGVLTQDNTIEINGASLYNFTSCSYLGLEHDSRLKTAAMETVARYGTQFSESRAYVSIEPYRELEDLLTEIFDAPALVAPTTTLAHLSAIPVLLNEKDAVIVDQQLHNSVLSGINVFRANCLVHFEVLRHNRMDLLEERIKALQEKHDRVWYFSDGIYSMFGDRCPVQEITQLLNSYPKFHAYIDDAHGMSILGERGQGYVLNGSKIHDKMVIASSMAKAFATGGGILVFPSKEMARRVRTCGAPFNSSGPLQPATLGAAVASAKIHLTNEIRGLQEELTDRIKYANELFKKTSLPVISNYDSAIFFIGTSSSDFAYDVMGRMMKKGFLVNLGVFPAVSNKNSGIRFTMTVLQSYEQIADMVSTLNTEFLEAMQQYRLSIDQIKDAFRVVARLEGRTMGTFLTE